jgi:outer membrane protein assembly factor BamB
VALTVALGAVGCGGGGGGDSGRGKESDATAPSAAAPPATAWEWTAPDPAYAGMPAADGDDVVATYGTVGLVLLNGVDGTVRWKAQRVDLRDVAPRLAPNVVLAAADDGVVAFERTTGEVRWDTKLRERANTPVVVGGRAVVSTWEGSLVALDLADGSVAWRTGLPGPALGPAATDGTVVVATWEAESGRTAGAVAVEAADGRQRWAVPLDPDGVSGPAVAGAGGDAPVVVVVAGDIAAHGLDLADGHERWHTDTEGAGSPEVPPLPLGDGQVLVAHRLGGLALLDAGTGRSRWTASSNGVAVRGGPAGASPEGPFAFPLDDGRVLVAAPAQESGYVGGTGRVSGVAVGPGGILVIGTREGPDNGLIALSGW